MVRNFHIIIMLVAGIIVSILGLINGYDLKKTFYYADGCSINLFYNRFYNTEHIK